MKGIFDELPIRYRLTAQLAYDDDQTVDCSEAWPADREWVDLGTVEMTGPDTERERDGDILVNDPMRVTDGIEPSDDPSCTPAPTSTAIRPSPVRGGSGRPLRGRAQPDPCAHSDPQPRIVDTLSALVVSCTYSWAHALSSSLAGLPSQNGVRPAAV